jgi:menaquinone-specific isochorismate synthase
MSLFAARLRPEPSAAATFRDHAVERGTVLWHDRGTRFAIGTAAVLPLPGGLADDAAVAAASEALGAVELLHDGGGDALPAAVAALPFDRSATANLMLPATMLAGDTLLLLSADRSALASAVASWERGRPPGLPRAPRRARPPEAFRLSSARSHEEFRDLVRSAVADIRAGELEKVVLVREVLAAADRPFRKGLLVERLRALYPSCTTFSVGDFVGASPELLVARTGDVVRAHPLAGTIGRSGDPATDARAEAALLASPKERAEHRVVVDAITAVLAPLCDQLDVPATPSIVELRNVSHLGSLVSGRLRAPSAGALELVARLHPTPAVAGTPTDEALAWIDKHEGCDRGPYAGPVGWVDAAGDGEWYVGIRAALVEGRRARLFAGVGVVADSDPEAELAETQLKLQALLAAAIRP